MQFVEGRPGVGPRRPELPQDRLDAFTLDKCRSHRSTTSVICDGGRPLLMARERRMPSNSSRLSFVPYERAFGDARGYDACRAAFSASVGGQRRVRRLSRRTLRRAPGSRTPGLDRRRELPAAILALFLVRGHRARG